MFFPCTIKLPSHHHQPLTSPQTLLPSEPRHCLAITQTMIFDPLSVPSTMHQLQHQYRNHNHGAQVARKNSDPLLASLMPVNKSPTGFLFETENKYPFKLIQNKTVNCVWFSLVFSKAFIPLYCGMGAVTKNVKSTSKLWLV